MIDGLIYCREQVRLFDRDRYLTALFAPTAERDDLFILYAFNLELAHVREAVRERVLGVIRLQWWCESLSGVYGESPLRVHAVTRALADMAIRREISRDSLMALIDGRARDLETAPPASLEALEAYGVATAGQLLGLALHILGIDPSSAPWPEITRHVGIAYALTGILRSVPAHARIGRVMLPDTLMAQNGFSPEALLGQRPLTPEALHALRKIAAAIAGKAQFHLAAARQAAQGSLRLRRALPALLIGRLTECQLDRLQRWNYDLFNARARDCSPLDIWWLLGAKLRGRF